MAINQQELIIMRMRTFAEANGWALVGMDLRGTEIQMTFSHMKPEAVAIPPVAPGTVVPPGGTSIPRG